jgi:hypothetical protein
METPSPVLQYASNTAPKSLVIDTLGLSPENVAALEQGIQALGIRKPVHFLE